MAKPNYQFEKRQRDIAKKKKKDEKRLKKAERSPGQADGQDDTAADPGQGAAPAGD